MHGGLEDGGGLQPACRDRDGTVDPSVTGRCKSWYGGGSPPRGQQGLAGQVALGRVDSSWSRALRWDRGVLRTRGEARTSRVSAVTSHEVMGCQSKCERGPTRLRPLAGGSAQIIRLGTVRMSCRLRPKVRILLFAAIFAKPQDDINIQALRNAVRRGWSGGRRNHVARAKARTILYSSSNAARARLKDAQCTLLGNGKRTT